MLTADTENREKLEKIVTATLDGKPIPITWNGRRTPAQLHDPRHRAQEAKNRNSCCAGTARHSASRTPGRKSRRVPALDEFAVTQTEAVQVNDQRQIQVHFSDALDTRQDLKGLVRLSQGEFTTSHPATTC